MHPKDDLNGVCHVLVWYSKEDESLVGEQEMRGISIDQLQAIFRPPQSDPRMYDSYPVGRDEARFLSQALRIELDLDRFDYYVECDAIDLPVP